MAPIKFEEQLKDKLEKRLLQPSPDAWDNLADRLDKEEQKRDTSKFWWIGIAATVVGVILVVTQFYKDNSEIRELPIVVETQTLPQSDSNNEKAASQEITKEEVLNVQNETIAVNHDTNEEDTSVHNSQEKDTQILLKKEPNKIRRDEDSNTLATLDNNKITTDENQPVQTLSQEELKIIEVVDMIKKLDSDETSVSDREIDSLLKQAQRDILKQRIFDESTKTVNADALLQDVEVELEQSFRDKVFEALRENFSSVKTAVAERNN